MKKKIGDDEEKFGDFPYFDLSIRSILLSFTPWNPVHNPHYLQLPAGRYLSPGLGHRSEFDLDASTGHQVPAGITCRSEELLAGTW